MAVVSGTMVNLTLPVTSVVAGGVTPYLTDLYVTRPDGTITAWPIVSLSSPFAFGPGEAGDGYFGVDQIGGWQAQAIVNGVASNVVGCALYFISQALLHVVPNQRLGVVMQPADGSREST